MACTAGLIELTQWQGIGKNLRFVTELIIRYLWRWYL